MSIPMILLPLFVQVLLTFALGVLAGGPARAGACAAARSSRSDIALREPNWPQHALQVGNAFSNQFELPVLFYVLTILAIITRQADLLFVVLAWVFVLSRCCTPMFMSPATIVPLRGAFSASARWCW